MKGWSCNGVGIAIDRLPQRKKLCLCILEGNTETKVASFNNAEAADFFFIKMQKFLENAVWREESE